MILLQQNSDAFLVWNTVCCSEGTGRLCFRGGWKRHPAHALIVQHSHAYTVRGGKQNPGSGEEEAWTWYNLEYHVQLLYTRSKLADTRMAALLVDLEDLVGSLTACKAANRAPQEVRPAR